MPKISAGNLAVYISIDQIIETGNVRGNYDPADIAELAESIKINGLLNPITVKKTKNDEYGNEQYELVCGHRRIRAYRHLCDQGQDYTRIPACIKSGNKNRLQLIENIQRKDLSAEEKETAIKEMLSAGMTQTQIAAELSKPISWVSDLLSGAKIRQEAETAGVHTAGIASKTLSQLRSIPPESRPAAIETLKKAGGTYRAATQISRSAKGISAENPVSPPQTSTLIPIEKVIAVINAIEKRNKYLSGDSEKEKNRKDIRLELCKKLIAYFCEYADKKRLNKD